jgi:hypothetical protein
VRTIGANPHCIYRDTRCLKNFEVEAAWSKVRQALWMMKDEIEVVERRATSPRAPQTEKNRRAPQGVTASPIERRKA